MGTDRFYEYSARYYDAAYGTVATLGPDAKFYEHLAVEEGGPVLELGCGTGRALLPIAARGMTCVGVDQSPAMLEQFRQKPGSGPVALYCGSMETFELPGQSFRLIFSAFRGFQHLDTVEQQLACLERVQAHLLPGGVFAFDVFYPRLERMVLDHEPEALDLSFVQDGRAVKRFVAVTRDRAKQLMQISMRYVEERRGEPSQETTVAITLRWFWRFELEHLLYRAGFTDVAIYGDFDRSPVGQASPALVVVAR